MFLKRIVQHINQTINQPDCVVLTGDITHDSGEASCQHLKSILSDLSCPVYITLGNHDIQAVIQQYLISDQITMPNVVEYDHWKILFADSHIEQQVAGNISSSTLEHITCQLKQNKPGLLFTHHPVVKINSQWMDKIGMKNGDDVLATLSQFNNLKLIAFGHIHQQWQSQFKHIDILGTPSSAAQFKPGSKEFAIDPIAPGYRLFHLHDDGSYETKVIRVDMQIEKIVSGGQTGVDRAALDVALQLAIPHGGWCPKDRKALDGAIDERYHLEETPSSDYPQRTEWNVRDSDGTLIICQDSVTGGTALTCRLAEQMQKPLLVIKLDRGFDQSEFTEWIQGNKINCLNIAGPRQDDLSNIYEQAHNCLFELLT